MSHHENIARIKAVYNALGDLTSEVIFIGGATVSLYADRPARESRPTDDVDVLIELLYYKDYAAIEEKLRARGFVNDIESGIICRYIVRGIVVDIMPTSGKILGFTNKWYKEAFVHAEKRKIDEDYTIRIFSPAYFIASKLEAYRGRGQNDGRMSSDFEDIVYILNNRTAIWQELKTSPSKVRQYLKDQFRKLLNEPYIGEWVSSHLDYNEQKRVNFILNSLQEFVE